MSRTVDSQCLYCKKELTLGDAIYVTNANLEPYFRLNRLSVVFSNSKNPKGALHRACWDNLFGITEEDVKINLTNSSRLDTIEWGNNESE